MPELMNLKEGADSLRLSIHTVTNDFFGVNIGHGTSHLLLDKPSI
jgi:hypothetical protein